MILLPFLFENAEFCIVNDNAKTHEPKPKEGEFERRNVKRSNSMPMDLMRPGPSRRRRRHVRRGSDPNLPPSRWSAEPASPPKAKKSSVVHQPQAKQTVKVDSAPTCVLRNVFQPVRQESREDIHQKSSCSLSSSSTDGLQRRHSLMPMMPVRQQSLREMVGCSPHNKDKKMDTVHLITQALKQLDSLVEMEDDDMDAGTTCSLPGLPTVQLA